MHWQFYDGARIIVNRKIDKRRVLFLSFVVISFYIFFTFPPTRAQSILNLNGDNYYAYLSKGYMSGQLSLIILPSVQLLALPDPYDPIENNGLRLHDASLYNGKYYLYFGPLPALSFFIPFKLLTGYYPSESLSVVFFLSLGFIMSFILLIRIKEDYFPELSEDQILFAGLLLAFSTTAPFLLTYAAFYQSAIASAYCAMSFVLYFLYKIIIQNFSKIINVVFFSFFLALAVSGRPNFSVVCTVLVVSVLIILIKNIHHKKIYVSITALLLPAAIIGVALALYNYLRFDSIFQFGEKYMLGGVEVSKLPSLFSLDPRAIKDILYLYFLQPFSFGTGYRHFPLWPHIHLKNTILHSGFFYYEPVCGILMTSPIIIFIIPLLLRCYFKNIILPQRLSVFNNLMLLISLTIMIIFMFCTTISATERYEMDFSPYLIFLSIISYWSLQKMPFKPWILTTTKILYIVLGTISILIGFDIGITGYGI